MSITGLPLPIFDGYVYVSPTFRFKQDPTDDSLVIVEYLLEGSWVTASMELAGASILIGQAMKITNTSGENIGFLNPNNPDCLNLPTFTSLCDTGNETRPLFLDAGAYKVKQILQGNFSQSKTDRIITLQYDTNILGNWVRTTKLFIQIGSVIPTRPCTLKVYKATLAEINADPTIVPVFIENLVFKDIDKNTEYSFEFVESLVSEPNTTYTIVFVCEEEEELELKGVYLGGDFYMYLASILQDYRVKDLAIVGKANQKFISENYIIEENVDTILCNNTSSIIVTIPDSIGKDYTSTLDTTYNKIVSRLIVKDIKGDTDSTKTITIKTEDETVVGFINTAYGIIELEYNSTYDRWMIINQGHYLEPQSNGDILFKSEPEKTLLLEQLVWKDLKGQLHGDKLYSPAGKITFNVDEITLDYATNAQYPIDMAVVTYEIEHSYKEGTDLYPHIHFMQDEDDSPNWLIEYRIVRNGENVTSWSLLEYISLEYTYTSGDILQVALFDKIDGTDLLISDFVDVRIYRDNSNASTLFSGVDTYSGLGRLKGIDLHYQSDTLGSRVMSNK